MAKIIDIRTRKKWRGPKTSQVGREFCVGDFRQSLVGNWVSIEEAAAPIVGGLRVR